MLDSEFDNNIEDLFFSRINSICLMMGRTREDLGKLNGTEIEHLDTFEKDEEFYFNRKSIISLL